MLPRALTAELREALEALGPELPAVRELRLRAGGTAGIVTGAGERMLLGRQGPIPVDRELIRRVLDRATGFSPGALRYEEQGLFLPLEGGCRL